MTVVFTTPRSVMVRTEDGRNFTLMEDIELRTDTGECFRVPIGAESDGASTPALLWPRIPPFGEYWLAAIVHDAAYRNTLQRQMSNGYWIPAMLDKDRSDTLLLDCMHALGVDNATADEIYRGVSLCGWRAFRQDRQSSP